MTSARTAAADFESLLEYLRQTRGFDVTAYTRPTLTRRVDARIAALGVESYDAYVDYLAVHPEELRQLFNSILINVTSFFRDPDTFTYLREHVIPALLQDSGRQKIRVWSAGCASGEECYSIAMLLAEALGPDQYRERVKIYATDVNEEELARARTALYTDRQVEAVPDTLRSRYFDRQGTQWVVKKDYRRGVIFGRHDLLDDAPISRVDLLVCRNTLMYFNQEAQAKIVSRFHMALRDGGYLVLGKAEMLLTGGARFSTVDAKRRVFTKVAADPLPEGGASRLLEIAFEQDPVAQLILDQRRRPVLANARARALFALSSRDVGKPLEEEDVPRQAQVTPILDAAGTLVGTRIAFGDVSRARTRRAT